MDEASLIIGEENWRGWNSFSITRSIEHAAGTFNLDLTERWSGGRATRPIDPGVSCTLEVAGKTLITGYIDDTTESFDAKNHTLSVRGRDKAGDLVDCSAIHQTGEWKNAKLEDIVRDLLKPFGISFILRVSSGKPFETFRIQEGETVFETIERACRQRGLLVFSNGLGALVIGSGSGRTNDNGMLKLGPGGNVKSLKAEASVRERFSQYTVKGQNIGSGFLGAEDIAGDEATVEHRTVGRYRPIIVLAEEPGDGLNFQERADWEKRVRVARAKRITATVQGLLDAAGEPWSPGDLVPCEFPHYTGDLLISQVLFSKGNGTVTNIELTAPGSFDTLADAESDGGLGW